MNRNLFIFVLILSITFGLNIPASAAGLPAVVSSNGGGEGEASGAYTLTKTAHVLYVEGYESESLVVYFEPFKFSQNGDTAQQLQKFSCSGAVIIDSKGKSLQSALVPGQEVKVTFTY